MHLGAAIDSMGSVSHRTLSPPLLLRGGLCEETYQGFPSSDRRRNTFEVSPTRSRNEGPLFKALTYSSSPFKKKLGVGGDWGI